MIHSSSTQWFFGPATRLLTVLLWVVMSSLFVACSALDDSRSDRGGEQHLTLAGSTFGPSTLDPALVRDAESAFLSRQVFRGLVSLDGSLQPQPELAESIEVSEDRLTYRFTLYESGTFHDGSRIDAQAVVNSFNRASDPALSGHDGGPLPSATYFADIAGASERMRGEAISIEGVTAIGLWTVEITLKRPTTNFLSKLAGVPAAIVDAGTAAGPDWWHSPNGSGPFRIASYDPGNRLELTSYTDYATGEPRLRAVTVLFGTGAQQPLNLYERGEIGITPVPGWAVDRLLSPADPLHPELTVTPLLSTTFVALNPNIEPFDEVGIRRLIASGIDREKIVNLTHDGRVQLADGLIAPGVLDTTWPSRIPPYDPDEARSLADGIGNVLPPPTLVEPGAGVSTLIAAVLERDLGIQLDVVDRPWPEFSADLAERDMPGFVLTWIADYPDPENMLADLLRTDSPDNYLGYANPAFDELIDRANAESDPAERRGLYLAAQQVAIDDAVVIPLYHHMSYTLVQPWVRGLEVTEIGVLSLEDVWIED